MSWCRSNAYKSPSYYVVMALARQRDPRAKDVFREILAMPRAKSAHLHALYGLVLLGVDPDEVDLDPDGRQEIMQMVARLEAPVGHPARHQGPNAELRAYMEKHIAERKRALVEAVTDGGLRLELSADPEVVRPNEKVRFAVHITNLSDRPVKVMRSRDGSDVGWVVPRILVQMWGPDHRPMRRGTGRCGNVNSLRNEDISELLPGETFDPFGPGSFPHYALFRFAPSVPGTYRIKLTYDTRSPAKGALGESGQRPEGVEPVTLVSNLVEIRVVPQEQKPPPKQ